MAAFARKCQQIFVAVIFTFHAGKAVVQITAIEVAVVMRILRISRTINGGRSGHDFSP